MKCIDSHQHFWSHDPIRDSWITEDMQVIRRDFYPEDLWPELQSAKVDACIAVQADQSEIETNFLLGLAEQHSFIKGVVGWVNLIDDKIEERLNYYSENHLLKGVRHIVQSEPIEFMLRKDFQNGISHLIQYGLTYDILVYPTQLEAAIKVVQSFPEQAFVLDHMAKPYIKEKRITDWKRDISKLAQYENVYCKVSGMVTEADWKNWRYQDFVPYLDIIFDNFGIDRIMYGSDWPVCLVAGRYLEIKNILETYLEDFSKEEQERIWVTNTCTFYNIERS